MGPSNAKHADLHRYCASHGPGSYNAADSGYVNWKRYLQAATGSSSNNVNELEMAFLGGTGTLADRWGAYLKTNGYCAAGTQFKEELRRYFASF